ncbi:MAG: GspH/FimT family pseudopilin [Thiomargarita sp.]|nr:GspH/FimT family pseudopilin [Thiomargarita sp.]
MNTQKQLGFNLIEVLVTLSVVGILATIGLPNLNGFLLNNKLTSRTNKLVSTFNFTRGEAIMQNGPVHLTAITADDWGKGWTIWVDRNGNGEPDADVDPPEILHEVKFSGTTTIKLEDDNFNATSLDTLSIAQVDDDLKDKTLSYTGGNGTLALTGLIQFNICDNRTGEKGRKIEIRPTGRVALTDDEFQCQ